LIDKDHAHRALYQVFLDVRDAAAKILENTTLADIVSEPRPGSSKGEKRSRKKKHKDSTVLPMLIPGTGSQG
jgi:DNA-binding IscR family transcriptional regulator